MSLNATKTTAERLIVTLFVLLGTALIIGCDNKTAPNSNTGPVSSPPQQAQQPIQQTMPGKTGSITANPNPIPVCDGSGLGITTLSWDVPGSKRVEVHVGSPVGGLLALSSGPGSQATGKWVGPGSVFYLQDVSNGLPPTADNTIATVTVNVTTHGCP